MKFYLSVIVISTLLNNQCQKGSVDIPECVQRKIDSIKAEPKWNPPAEVSEFIYKKKRAYLFTSNCCDQYTLLYDGYCSPICAPSGGIAGKGDGKCADFYEAATFVRSVWKDNR
ncbi:MAG: hypothetical protein ABUT20_22250 [Bacteroidota bacterium]